MILLILTSKSNPAFSTATFRLVRINIKQLRTLLILNYAEMEKSLNDLLSNRKRPIVEPFKG
jgi:hypothetical protein